MPIVAPVPCREYPGMKPSAPQLPERSEMTSQLRELASFIAYLFTGKLH